MNTSVSCFTAPVVQGIVDAGETVKRAVEGCRKKGRRAISQIGEGVERYTQQFKAEHPVATRNLKTFGDYAVKAARVARDGIQATAKGAVSIHNRITETYHAAKKVVETRCPKAAIAMKSLSEFTLNPITNALKGFGIGLGALVVAETVFSVLLTETLGISVVLAGVGIGAAYGLAKAALNSARYTLKLEGKQQHPHLAKAVGLCDRILSPIKEADRFMEGLHPALSIPYKALKECAVAAINIPALWGGGVLGLIVLNDAIGMSYQTQDAALMGTLYGGIALGLAKPVWDTGKFAYQRICEHIQPKEQQPVLSFSDESDPDIADLV